MRLLTKRSAVMLVVLMMGAAGAWAVNTLIP